VVVNSTEVACVAEWMRAARGGSREALGAALDACRNYLLLVANQELDADLQGKIGPSDLVQETFLEGQRDFGRFQGESEEELLAWLRRILVNNVANAVRHYKHTSKRNVNYEVPFADAPVHAIASGAAGPGIQAQAQERDESLRRALEQLQGSTRDVIQWRNYELCSFEEIGARLGRSAEGARKLWARALIQLKNLLEPPHDSRGRSTLLFRD
jgi:RNA polymerase sigma-70 factor, ECF subfamily